MPTCVRRLVRAPCQRPPKQLLAKFAVAHVLVPKWQQELQATRSSEWLLLHSARQADPCKNTGLSLAQQLDGYWLRECVRACAAPSQEARRAALAALGLEDIEEEGGGKQVRGSSGLLMLFSC